MEIKILNNYMTDENTYLLYKDGEGIVIDPGIDCEKIIEEAENLNVKIKYIFITHCHYDHIEYMEELKSKTGALIISGAEASKNIGNPSINLSVFGLGYEIKSQKSDIILNDGEEREFANMNVKCIYTPGHSNCSVCYIIDGSLFSGDTLFLRSIGRCDLPTGDSKTISKSIKEKIYTLPDEMKIYSGHGKPTSVEYEKKFNFFVKG